MQNFKNAHPQDVEEILASIRSSIAEEANTMVPVTNAPVAQSLPIKEEHTEFELPAIFKQQPLAQPAGELRPRSRPLPRLRDELAQVTINGVPDVVDNVTSLDAARRTEGAPRLVPFGPLRMGHHFTPRLVEAAPQPAPAPEPDIPSSAINEADAKGMKREMTSFMDSRMSKMGAMSQQAPKPAPPQPAPQINHAPARPAAPPPVPEATGGVDDVAAQLLRPMLQKWLSDNMPRIVEKALRNEIDGQ